MKGAADDELGIGVGDAHGNQCRCKGVGIPRCRRSKNKDQVHACPVCSGTEESLQAKFSGNFMVNGRHNAIVLKRHKGVMPEHGSAWKTS